jgi:hypothetical protein
VTLRPAARVIDDRRERERSRIVCGMPGREPRIEAEPLDFEGVLGKLAGMMGHDVLVAIGPASDPVGAPAGSRSLQTFGRLRAAIDGQAEISSRRPPGRDVFIGSLDSGATLIISEKRLTQAVFHRAPDEGNETLVVTLGPLRMTIEDLDALRAHQARGATRT